MVTLTGTQTLTNKTIVAANNTITTAASGNLTATELNAALAELQADVDTRQVSGSYEPAQTAASQAEMEAGTEAAIRSMSPIRVKQAIDALASVTFASNAENAAGTIEDKAVDPLGIREAFNATGSAPVYACRAWGTVDPTSGTPSIVGSGNVSSITDNGVGNYSVNFTTDMPDANYSVVMNGPRLDTDTGSTTTVSAVSFAAGSFIVDAESGNSNPSQVDNSIFSFAVFR